MKGLNIVKIRFKNVICLLLVVAISISTSITGFAKQNNSTVKHQGNVILEDTMNSKNHLPTDIYYDEKIYSFSDIAKLHNEQIISKTDSKFDSISAKLNKIRNDVKDNNSNKDGTISFKTLYIGVSDTGIERKLTYADIDQINSFKKYKASNYNPLLNVLPTSDTRLRSATGQSKTTYACTFVITATKIKNGYNLCGAIEWNYPPNMFIGNERPADGDDAVGFSWEEDMIIILFTQVEHIYSLVQKTLINIIVKL